MFILKKWYWSMNHTDSFFVLISTVEITAWHVNLLYDCHDADLWTKLWTAVIIYIQFFDKRPTVRDQASILILMCYLSISESTLDLPNCRRSQLGSQIYYMIGMIPICEQSCGGAVIFWFGFLVEHFIICIIFIWNNCY